ncbi:hypothetical protein BUALT_Bualt03G0031100 [Buddleja alternifolia]|uniref:Uncharacterized protein n=1 Tax=Buddleja alternifolia TaxID=168488 RepID=A0AAV6XV47_9LAMI|nr:hypothetical protein BUALT_Bualt03G0031100 [Buddleja alternifolia]
MRRSSASPHAQFFTSLKHLEKRLKLENDRSPPSAPPPPLLPIEHHDDIKSTQQSDSLGTPIYLNCNQSTINTNTSNVQESEIPQEFLSNSPDFPPTHHSIPQENHQAEIHETVDQSGSDDIDALMQLLRLSGSEERNDVGCDDGFYGKIVGVKGPKSGKEVERLEGWIKHFLNGDDEETEPFRLAHLLLAKAAFVHWDDGDCVGFGGFVFPSTVDEFLQNDPPIEN